ncbi:MAG TPA: class I SAM-dependent methyltransferase [Chitinophagaceae bacterium]|nr:class I SAM-dependent methyltransferase [Chitinophagaceae bacterium]
MDTRAAYNVWAHQYDTNLNKTRDLEAEALRSSLSGISFENCLEIGCGTGKNTAYFVERAKLVTAVDLSDQMLEKARQKITSPRVEFRLEDITAPWSFEKQFYNLVTFSLVLEHIKDLDHVFRQAVDSMAPGGHVYIGELHPFKQYAGTKARFESENGVHVVECFNHHVSDFIIQAKKNGLSIVDVSEFFDDNDRKNIPRILTIILKKS